VQGAATWRINDMMQGLFWIQEFTECKRGDELWS